MIVVLRSSVIEQAESIADEIARDMPGSRFTKSDIWVAARDAAIVGIGREKRRRRK